MPEVNQFYVGDSFELVKTLQDNSIDLIICDGPYGVTQNKWDRVKDIQAFNYKLIQLFSRVLKPGGTLYLFGKQNCIDFIDYRKYLTLVSRIIWYQPSRLAQGRKRFTNNYDLIAHFQKGDSHTFNLDAVRVPQLVELAHRKRCENVPSVKNGKWGKTKFNGKGKNPGDVWGDIKQLTYKSKELVNREYLNTIQKPEKLIERLVLASSNEGDLVFDPFAGVGTTGLVCKKHNRNFIGFELDSKLVNVAKKRFTEKESVL